jgi:23S rRNA (guanosine2251-2'-O)-methyltransferase
VELRPFLELNEAMALRFLVDCLQDVEMHWADPLVRKLKMNRLLEVLDWAALHRSESVKELARLQTRIPEDPDYHQFMSLAVPIERAHSRGVADPDISARSRDRVAPLHARIPLVLVIDNIRSAFNVGSILRIAECLGVEHIYLCGYTATPEQDVLKKAAMGTEDLVSWSWEARCNDLLMMLKFQGFKIYGLETSDSAKPLENYPFPEEKTALVFGNERHGLEADTLRLCDATLEIPCRGQKNSLNVAVSLGIAVYEWRRRWAASR